jgi:hypothetical protein
MHAGTGPRHSPPSGTTSTAATRPARQQRSSGEWPTGSRQPHRCSYPSSVALRWPPAVPCGQRPWKDQPCLSAPGCSVCPGPLISFLDGRPTVNCGVGRRRGSLLRWRPARSGERNKGWRRPRKDADRTATIKEAPVGGELAGAGQDVKSGGCGTSARGGPGARRGGTDRRYPPGAALAVRGRRPAAAGTTHGPRGRR